MNRRLACVLALAALTGCASTAAGPAAVDNDSAPFEDDSATLEDTAEAADTGIVKEDSKTADTFVADTSVEDTATADTVAPDTATVDTGPKDTGPPACNAVTPGYYVTLDARRENTPTTLTWSGGVIPDGIYELKTYVEYNGPSGVGTYLVGGKSGEAIQITGNAWNRSFRPTGGYPNRYENYDAELTGTDWKLTKTCGTTTSYTSKSVQHYSVTATGFVLYQGYDTTGSVSTYARK